MNPITTGLGMFLLGYLLAWWQGQDAKKRQGRDHELDLAHRVGRAKTEGYNLAIADYKRTMSR